MTQFPDGLNPSPPDPQPGGTDPQDPRRILEHVPAHRRSTFANWFHEAARSGATTPHAVWSAVSQAIQHRLQWASTPETRQFLQDVLDILQTHKTEALAYAASIIAYEKLPHAERQKIKGRRALNFVMQGKEPTLPQLAYLRSLGYQGDPPTDRATASQLIDQLRQRQGGAQ